MTFIIHIEGDVGSDVFLDYDVQQDGVMAEIEHRLIHLEVRESIRLTLIERIEPGEESCDNCGYLRSCTDWVDFGPGGIEYEECTDPDPVDHDVEKVCEHWIPPVWGDSL
jgi:hypothetical protein